MTSTQSIQIYVNPTALRMANSAIGLMVHQI